MQYSDDRIAAIEYEGQKYRSYTLLGRAIAESLERKYALRVWKTRPKVQKISGCIGFVLVLIFFIGGNGLLDFHSSPDRPLAITPWLSVPLMILSGCGFFLSVHLDDFLELRWVRPNVAAAERERMMLIQFLEENRRQKFLRARITSALSEAARVVGEG